MPIRFVQKTSRGRGFPSGATGQRHSAKTCTPHWSFLPHGNESFYTWLMASKKKRSRRSSRRSRHGNTRRDIENAGLSGLPVSFEQIARVSRNKRVVTLRHAWADDVDGRIWSAVRRTFLRGAQKLANETRKSVEVYAKQGWLIEAVEPS